MYLAKFGYHLIKYPTFENSKNVALIKFFVLGRHAPEKIKKSS